MGLSVVQAEIATSLGFKSGEELALSADKVETLDDRANDRSLEWFRVVDEVRTSALSAVDVLSDLLSYDKIEAGQLQLELTVIPFWRLVESTVNEFRLSATEKKLQLTLQFSTEKIHEGTTRDTDDAVSSISDIPDEVQDLKVVGDAVRLTQVLRNLLSNAIKFTPESGTVRVETGWTRKEEVLKTFDLKTGIRKSFPEKGELRLTVEDNGFGLSRNQLGQLFQQGMQFDAGELQAGKGSGLGLYISRGITEQHGGTLSAFSEGIGQGTTFTLSLPLFHAPTSEGSMIEISPGQIPQTIEAISLKILVVDDVASNRKLLGRLLKNRGHSYDEAEDGESAVEMATAAVENGLPYDTILMDYEMPLLNGPLAAKKIRQSGNRVFIVGVTGNLLPEDCAYFRSCGANAVLPKPFTIVDLETLWIANGIVTSVPKAS